MDIGSSAGAASDWELRTTLGRHFLRDMESLWGEILKMAGVVELSVNNSVRALCDGRADLAAQVKGEEKAINDWEIQIERACLRVLALHQPVASDLRRVATVLKINSDLERMSDLAEHIAKRARKHANDPEATPIPHQLEIVAMQVLEQVRDGLDALAKSDPDLAREVVSGDRRIDREHRVLMKELKQSIRDDPQRVDTWLRLINTARNLERIADHAANIAKAVVYLKEGAIIRHAPVRKKAEPA